MELPQSTLDKIMDLADGLYTDVIGKAELIESDRDDVMDRIQDIHYTCDLHMDAIFEAVKTAGDNQLIDLIALSKEMVDELTELNDELDAMNDGDYYNL